MEIKAKSKNYIIRDLTIWFIFILILPLSLFIGYHIIKHSQIILTNNSNLSQIGLDNNLPMKRVLLTNYPNSKCNDGSVASYYIKQSNSKKWLILLDGGYFCYDQDTCTQRALNSINLTSSNDNRLFKFGKGILSSNPNENKYWFDINLVNIPYCSSDLWIGKKLCINNTCSQKDNFNFMGSEILNSVLDDLLENYSMKDGRLLMLTGESAGGIGVLMNLNQIKDKLNKQAPNLELKAIIDSSWLLDLPYSFLCNQNEQNKDCFIHKIFKNSIKYWNAQIPKECVNESENIWDCFLPYKLLSFIKAPIFVIQSLFDESQMIEQFSMIESGSMNRNLKSVSFVDTIYQMVNKTKKSIHKLQNFFVPACTSHMILTRSDWNLFKIGDNYLDDLLNCWVSSNKCETKLVEKCTYPNCNRSCPDLRHPDTNQSINPIEYFSYFGLINYNSLSSMLKISENVLKKMSYFKLIKILMNFNQ